MFITSLDLTPPYSCLFSCSSPAEIWLKNIYIVHHPRNAEEKRNLKHGSFVCLTKPPLWWCNSQGKVNFYCDMLALAAQKKVIGTRDILQNSESSLCVETM